MVLCGQMSMLACLEGAGISRLVDRVELNEQHSRKGTKVTRISFYTRK